MKQQVAIYLRLSQEDIDRRTSKVKDESNSISAQRLLITRHLDLNPSLNQLPRLEFCDDGYTGTSFDRPAFSRMIELVKRGEISCIVVKDLSRFGRDYLEVGDYLEHIFPFLGVRFKAINDHYDSIKHSGKTIGMDIAFRNLIYDYYCKDLSKKVKSAMGLKQKEARYVSCAPYGYQVCPTVKHQLVIDPEAAAVVRRIFLDVIAGKSTSQIATELNSEGIQTPTEHKGRRSRTDSRKPQWTHHTILNIIENLKYTGTMVNHTRESRHIRDGNQRRVPKDEWYLRENAHEAIVTLEEFHQAQNAISRRRKAVRSRHDQSDRVYYCGHCGRKLEKANGISFSCPSHRYHSGSPCDEVQWQKDALEEAVFEALKVQIEIVQLETADAKSAAQSKENNLKYQLTTLRAQYDACGREKFEQYEAYREGRITDELFLSSRDRLTLQQSMLKERIKECESQYEASRKEMEVAGEKQQSINSMTGLTEQQLRDHLYDAIERIIVYGPNDIEIVWKFQDTIVTA